MFLLALVVVSFIYNLTFKVYLLIQDVFLADHVLIRQQVPVQRVKVFSEQI